MNAPHCWGKLEEPCFSRSSHLGQIACLEMALEVPTFTVVFECAYKEKNQNVNKYKHPHEVKPFSAEVLGFTEDFTNRIEIISKTAGVRN